MVTKAVKKGAFAHVVAFSVGRALDMVLEVTPNSFKTAELLMEVVYLDELNFGRAREDEEGGKHYPGDKLSAEERAHLNSDMLHGFDFDATMLRIASTRERLRPVLLARGISRRGFQCGANRLNGLRVFIAYRINTVNRILP